MRVSAFEEFSVQIEEVQDEVSWDAAWYEDFVRTGSSVLLTVSVCLTLPCRWYGDSWDDQSWQTSGDRPEPELFALSEVRQILVALWRGAGTL